MRPWQRLQGRLVFVIGGTIAVCSLTSLLLLVSIAANRNEELLAHIAGQFLRLSADIAQGPDGALGAIATLQRGDVVIADNIPPGYRQWPWLSGVSEQALNRRVAAQFPQAQVRLTVMKGQPILWTRAPSLLDGVWLGFPVSVRFMPPYWRLLLWLSVISGLTLLIAGYLSRQITRPLEDLAETASLLGYGIELPPWRARGTVEIQRLAVELHGAAATVRRNLHDRELLFAEISHDLRTPLTRLRLALELLQPGRNSDEHELLGGMGQDLDDMDALVRRFMEQLREGVDERPTTVELTPLLDELVNSFRGYGHDVRLHSRAQRTAEVLPLSLRRLLRNLIQNAIDHGVQPVEVEAWTSASEACISVRDHGRGLNEKRLAVLRRRAQRQSFGTARAGRGLGLRIAERIAESLHGELRFENLQPGLRVELRWPLRWSRRKN